MPAVADLTLYEKEAKAASRESILRRLKIYHRNLNHLMETKAQYGLDVPTHLSNEIEATEEAIARLEQELSELDHKTFENG